MSCKEEDKRTQLLEHLKNHVAITCPACLVAMECSDGAIPFGNAMMTTWRCQKCPEKKIIVIREDGQILEG